MKRYFRESVYNGDKGRASRERRLQRFNAELASLIEWQEILPDGGPIGKMGPEGLAKRFTGLEIPSNDGRPCIGKSLASAEEYRNLGDSWKRIVDNGCQKSNNPKGIGKYQQPEPVTVTSAKGVMSGSYRNQNGNPISDAYSGKWKSNAEYKRHKRKFRKVVSELTAPAIKTDMSAITAHQYEATDYRRFLGR